MTLESRNSNGEILSSKSLEYSSELLNSIDDNENQEPPILPSSPNVNCKRETTLKHYNTHGNIGIYNDDDNIDNDDNPIQINSIYDIGDDTTSSRNNALQFNIETILPEEFLNDLHITESIDDLEGLTPTFKARKELENLYIENDKILESILQPINKSPYDINNCAPLPPPLPLPLQAAAKAAAAAAAAAASQRDVSVLLSPQYHDFESVNFIQQQAIKSRKEESLTHACYKAKDLLQQAKQYGIQERLENLKYKLGSVGTNTNTTNESIDDDKIIEEKKLNKAIALVDKLKSLLDEAEKLLAMVHTETVDVVQYYIRQGIQLSNRIMQREAMTRLDADDRTKVDKQLVQQAEQVLKELDTQHVIKEYLSAAIIAKDALALEEAIHKASMANMNEEDYKELSDANKLLNKLHEKHKKENSKRVSSFILKLYKTKDKSVLSTKEVVAAAAAAAAATAKSKYNNVQDNTTISSISHSSPLFGTPQETVVEIFGRDVYPKIYQPSSQDTNILDNTSIVKVDNDVDTTTNTIRVPSIVADCQEYISSHNGQLEDGIFRHSGSNDIMTEIIQNYEIYYADQYTLKDTAAQTTTTLNSPANDFTNVNDAANVQKKYLRALSQPQIPYNEYPKWIVLAHRLRNDPNSEQSIQELRTLCYGLPILNRYTMHYLMIHLNYIAKYSHINRMTDANLSIVFAPNLLRPRQETPQGILSDTPLCILIITSLIKHAEVIFALSDLE